MAEPFSDRVNTIRVGRKQQRSGQRPLRTTNTDPSCESAMHLSRRFRKKARVAQQDGDANGQAAIPSVRGSPGGCEAQWDYPTTLDAVRKRSNVNFLSRLLV